MSYVETRDDDFAVTPGNIRIFSLQLTRTCANCQKSKEGNSENPLFCKSKQARTNLGVKTKTGMVRKMQEFNFNPPCGSFSRIN